jgi:hypothetical protein
MQTINKSKCWGKKEVEVKSITGLILAYGGVRYTRGTKGRKLSDDYLEDLKALRVPALLNNRTGMNIEEIYEEANNQGFLPELPDEYPDPAAYILDLINQERITKRPYFKEIKVTIRCRPVVIDNDPDFIKEED